MKTVMLNIRGGTFEHLLLLRLILCEIFLFMFVLLKSFETDEESVSPL